MTPEGATVSRVQGVVALGLGGLGTATRQYLDCNGTNNAIENLQWSKDNGGSITTASRSHALRLDLSLANDQDEGIYTCRDTVTGDTVSSTLQEVRIKSAGLMNTYGGLINDSNSDITRTRNGTQFLNIIIITNVEVSCMFVKPVMLE